MARSREEIAGELRRCCVFGEKVHSTGLIGRTRCTNARVCVLWKARFPDSFKPLHNVYSIDKHSRTNTHSRSSLRTSTRTHAHDGSDRWQHCANTTAAVKSVSALGGLVGAMYKLTCGHRLRRGGTAEAVRGGNEAVWTRDARRI